MTQLVTAHWPVRCCYPASGTEHAIGKVRLSAKAMGEALSISFWPRTPKSGTRGTPSSSSRLFFVPESSIPAAWDKSRYYSDRLATLQEKSVLILQQLRLVRPAPP